MTIAQRRTGWLTPAFSHAWQLALIHACARYKLVCPAYVLMPGHAHALLLGFDNAQSDQRLAIEFLREHLRPALAPADWQHQPHDQVLREADREHGAFQTVAHYILENPVRAGLVSDWHNDSYTGVCAPGCPELDIRAADYWERFWRVHNYLVKQAAA